LEIVDYKGQNEEEETKIKEMKVALYNNLAACYLKLQDFQNAIAACCEVLVLDPTQAKAWFLNFLSKEFLSFFRYRRAKATVSKNNPGFQEYAKAKDDLRVAFGLDPNDSVIEELYNKVTEVLEKFERDKKDSLPNKNQKEKPEAIIEEIKHSVPLEKDKRNQEVQQNKKQQETQQNLNKKSDKGNKQEKVNSKKEQEEAKIETQSTASDVSSEKDAKGKYAGKIESDNDVWKMLHGDVDPNSQNFSYELSFEINPHAKVPKEIQEFGK